MAIIRTITTCLCIPNIGWFQTRLVFHVLPTKFYVKHVTPTAGTFLAKMAVFDYYISYLSRIYVSSCSVCKSLREDTLHALACVLKLIKTHNV